MLPAAPERHARGAGMGGTRIIEQPVAAAARVAEGRFPDSDGRFLPENDTQAEAVLSVRYALTRHYTEVEDVYLAGNLFVYYDKDDDAASVASDVFVVLGTARGRRTSYKVWEEGKPPDFVLEVMSPSSEGRDLVDKAGVYPAMGVREYFVYQPDPERRGYRLSGRQLSRTGYVELQPVPGPECGAGAAQRGAVTRCVAGRRAAALAGLGERTGIAVAGRGQGGVPTGRG